MQAVKQAVTLGSFEFWEVLKMLLLSGELWLIISVALLISYTRKMNIWRKITCFFVIITITSQLAHNIPGIFVEYSFSVAKFQISREHLKNILKENTFKKINDEKVVFVLKVYDLTITNDDLLVNSSNHKAMFPEYSKNIPRISVSKIFQGYPWNIVRLWKCFYEVLSIVFLMFYLMT